MKRFSILLALLFLAAGDMKSAVEWMWVEGDRMGTGEVELRREFRIDILPEGDVRLRALGDFCGFEVVVNGRSVARAEAYDPASEVTIRRWLRVGDNAIVVRATGVEGPSAVAVEVIAGESGDVLVASGAEWEGAVGFGALERLRLGNAEPEAIGALDEYNQWMEAKGGSSEAKFSDLPDGFRLECLRTARADEGSWISMAFDPKGRLVVSREKRGLFRMDPTVGEGAVLETIDDTLLECRGLLFAHDSLYANANNSRGLYRLRDTNGDDQFDEVRLLMKTEGEVGHGRNDLVLGPEGRIYAIHGDSVRLPSDVRRLMPELPEGRSEQGYLVSMDEDGGRRRLHAIGLRNPYGIAFNRDGEAFTYDADNEGDIGLPLYRPARVNHLVSGGNYGWQQGDGESWPVYAPESLPTTLDAGRGSPTAIAFGTGSQFPPRYRDALFLLDWAYGRILVVDVLPHGASYRCQAETFLRGRPLNVTDLAFGPEGALYFITGGRGTQSALYRIRYEGEAVSERVAGAQEQARNAFSKEARALRKRLERFHGFEAPDLYKEIWPNLKNPDPWIRHAALVALEWQPVERWKGPAKSKPWSQDALLALVRVGENDHYRFRFNGKRHEKLIDLRVLELDLERGMAPKTQADCRVEYAPHFPDGDTAVDRELSKLLVRLNVPEAVPKSLALLAASDSQAERLHYLDVLSRAREGWTPEGRRAFFEAIRHPDYFRGDRNMPGFVNAIRLRAVETLSAEERADLGPLVAAAGAEPPVPDEPRPLVQHWTIDDLTGMPPDGYARDPKRGREIFEKALCSRCHQAGGLGNAVGPNLTAVAARFSRRDLIEAIVEPSRAIAEIFRNEVIVRKDGTTAMGRVVRDDFRESTISISANPFAPAVLNDIAKGDIVSHEPSAISPMPPGLLDTFSREEVHQLLDFLTGKR